MIGKLILSRAKKQYKGKSIVAITHLQENDSFKIVADGETVTGETSLHEIQTTLSLLKDNVPGEYFGFKLYLNFPEQLVVLTIFYIFEGKKLSKQVTL